MASLTLPPFAHPFELAARVLRGARHGLSDLAELRARLARRHPVLASVAFLPGLLLGTGLVAAVYVLPPLVRPFGGEIVTEIRDADARRQGTALYDASGRWIGAFPSRFDRSGRFNAGETAEYDTDISGREFAVHPDYKTLFVENPPQPYLTCLKALEDSNLGNLLINPHGIDGAGLLRAASQGFRGGGGSTLSSQLVQQLIRPKGSYQPGMFGTLQRKVEDIFWTVPVMYGHAPGDRRFDQYLARHLPHLRDTQDHRGTVWGIEASSQVLWGKPAAQLDQSEQFILAAAVHRQILFPLAHDEQMRLRDNSKRSSESWQRAIKRARRCASNPAVVAEPAERARIGAQLNAMALADAPKPKADPVIDALGRERYGVRWPERARDPFRRANIFASYAMAGLSAEFSDAFGLDWAHRIAQVTTTIDIADERRFAPQFRQRLRDWLAGREDLNPYYRPWATYRSPSSEPEEIPEAIVAVSDADGRLVRYYSSVGGAPYFGSQRDALGGYQPAKEDRQIASLGKIGSALVILQAGSAGDAAVQAFAHSDTDAMVELVAAADPDRRLSRAIITGLHWSEASARAVGGQALDPAFSLAHGYLAAAPRTQHWAAGAVTAALAGDGRPVSPPSLLETLRLVDLDAGTLGAPMRRLGNPYRSEAGNSTLDPAALIPPALRNRARLLMSAPVCGGGTLRALADWCQPARIRLIWGKTATMDISSAFSSRTGASAKGVVLRIAITGGVVFVDGRRYSFYLSVSGQDAGHPLTIGKPDSVGLEASRLAPLLDIILSDLENGGQTDVR